jgi:protein-disulfide isomerase
MSCLRVGLVVVTALAGVTACGGRPPVEGAGAPGGNLAIVPEVLAEIDGQPITREEVDARIRGRLVALRQQEYELRRQAIEQIVDERIFAREAARRGLSRAELLEREVEAQIPRPSAEEVKTFFEANVATMRGRSLDQVRGAIEQTLRDDARKARTAELRLELEGEARVRVLLEPVRHEVPIPASAPSVGPEDAPVTIVQFTDYQCPYCRQAHPTVDRLRQEYAGRVRLVFRDFPLDSHERALAASKAVRCAAEQGHFWSYHSGLFETPSDYSDDDFRRRAVDLGIDREAFDSCRASPRHDGSIESAMADGQRLGVTGTPVYFVNGQMLVGAPPLERFRRIIDAELARGSD